MGGQIDMDAGTQAKPAVVEGRPVAVPPLSVKSGVRANRLKRRLMLADAFALSCGIVLAFQLQRSLRPVPREIALEHLALVAVSLPCFAVGAGLNRLYQARANERQDEEVWNILKSVGLCIGGLLAVAFALQYKDLSRFLVVLLAASMTLTLLIERAVARGIFTRLRASGAISRRIVIIGTDPHAIGLMHTYERNPGLGYEVVGFVGDDDLCIGVRIPVA